MANAGLENVIKPLSNNNEKQRRVFSPSMLAYRTIVLSIFVWSRIAFIGECAVEEVIIDPADGNISQQDEALNILTRRLLNTPDTNLTEQQAVNIAHVLEQIKSDPETAQLLFHMKDEATYQDFARDLSGSQVVTGLQQALSEMEMAELLFQGDLHRAVREMDKDGMIPPHRLDEYTKNPKLLEDDTKKSLYFTFVSFASAGGFL